MIVRTVDEIKAYYEELREAFKRTNGGDDDWVGEPIKEKWLLLDRISELEARIGEVAQQAQQRSSEHHNLAVEYLEDGKPEMAQSSRTLASCYAKVAEWLTQPSSDPTLTRRRSLSMSLPTKEALLLPLTHHRQE